MNTLQTVIDGLEKLKRSLGREYDKFPNPNVKARYNEAEDAIQNILKLDPLLARKSKEYYL